MVRSDLFIFHSLKIKKNMVKYRLVNKLIIFLFSIMFITVILIPTVNSQKLKDGWEFTLNFSELGGKTDLIVFGETSYAFDSIDESDVPDPGVPPTPPYVNAYFTTLFLYPHTNLMHEFKHYSTINTYKIWNFTLMWQGNENSNITITWNLTEFNDCEYDAIFLCNDTSFILEEMLLNNTYTFNCPALIPQYFKIKCILYYTLNLDTDGNGKIDLDKNGPYEHGDMVTLEAIPSNGYIFSKWSGDHIGSTNPTTIAMDSNKNITANFVKKSSGGNSGGGGGIPPPMNLPPVADASVGKPYNGYVGEEVTFNGSLSYDQDGYIISWFWDFGDGAEENGETTTHSYLETGNYIVTLTVTDNIGSTNTDTVDAFISPKSNIAPSKPTFNGPITGNKGVSYTYNASASDADKDQIKYIFNWGDNTNITTDYLPSGTKTIQNHTWIIPGKYTIWVQAIDNKDETSEKTYLNILIDTIVISGKIQGDLIDEDSDGIYDSFYNISSENKSYVSQNSDGYYLIDSNSDDKWDFIFDSEKGELKKYNSDKSELNAPQVYNIEVTIIAILSLISLIISYVIIKRYNKKKNKLKKH